MGTSIWLTNKVNRTTSFAPMSFSAWLAAERAKRGWSLQKLADDAGIDQPLISMYERGLRKPRRINVIKIAAALGVDASGPLMMLGMLPDAHADEEIVLTSGRRVQVVWKEGDPGEPLVLDDYALRFLEMYAKQQTVSTTKKPVEE